MTKSKKIALNTIVLIVGNILFWACNIYPKHILEFSSVYSLISIFLNLIYFVIFDYFLIIVFSQNKALFSKNIFDATLPVVKRFKIWKLIILLLIQIVVDGFILLLNKTATEWTYIGKDVLIILHWFAIYTLLAEKSSAIWKRPAFFAGCLVAGAILLCASIWLDIEWIADIAVMAQKYEAESPAFISIKTNVQFAWSIKALILDTAFGLILIWLHILNTKSEETDPDLELSRGRTNSAFFIQIFVVINVAVLLMVFKFAVWPEASLQMAHGHSSRQGLETSDFYIELTEYELIRKGKGGLETVCYETHSYALVVNQTERISITSPVKWPYSYHVKNGQIMDSDNRESLDINGTKAYLFYSQIIGFYDNSMPRAVTLDEISDLESNDTITAILENILSDGNIFIFEYACDYLLVNDQAFIRPYIERYAEGRFTDIEKEWMEKNFYKSEYIISIAKTFA